MTIFFVKYVIFFTFLTSFDCGHKSNFNQTPTQSPKQMSESIPELPNQDTGFNLRLTGLPNLGNTCFLNAILQVFRPWILATLNDESWIDRVKSDKLLSSDQKNNIITVWRLIGELLREKDPVAIEIKYSRLIAFLKSNFGHFFGHGIQQDPNEAIHVLGGDLFFGDVGIYVEFTNHTVPDGETRIKSDYFMELTFEINSTSGIISQCLSKQWGINQTAEYVSDFRNKNGQQGAYRANVLSYITDKPPEKIILHLKLFGFDRVTLKNNKIDNYSVNLNDYIDVPFIMKDKKDEIYKTLSKIVSQNPTAPVISEVLSQFIKNIRYRITAVVVHIGTLTNNGHYIAYKREKDNNGKEWWVKYDDNTVTVLPQDEHGNSPEVASINPYIILAEQVI